MTRVNCVPPNELHYKHLVAEYREIPRIFELAYRAYMRGDYPWEIGAPDRYKLGAGHQKFFYDKLTYIAKRHRALVQEMRKRGYHVTIEYPETKWIGKMPSFWWGDWYPTIEAQEINRARINDRLKEMGVL